ncbi:ATP-dependent protease ClpP, protease subunit [Hymenobacter daecheongensis DSM 21074]|uniref:ATP-dependent protease ClpP, protease subunit n=1 Tax=Hymenobacter daecheongensis DSM 21074 TaxID=1121955 RepID=A0A1M6LX97_9BACT|nr:Clp protease ClpP [Hymenobacter daecheongensis]SHJ75806.1 ATP-dependent protease ClpP, protease subunit [Hymenobacter daecheongensis DSM 21074]
MAGIKSIIAGYNVTNQGGGVAEISITGKIDWWSNNSVDFTQQLALLRASGVTELRGYICTPGGSLYDANEIYNQLVAFPGRKTCVLGALVASAGTTIACAFTDGIEMAANGQYMIHDPCVYVEGGERELKAALQMYYNIRKAAIDIYVKRTGLEADEVSEMMAATTWMNAETAKEKGFVTGTTGAEDALPTNMAQAFTSYNYKNVPAALNQVVMAHSLTIPTTSSTMNKNTIIASMGLSANATDAEVETAIAQMSAAKIKAENDLKEEREKGKKEKAEMLVDAGIAAKKIPAGQRDAFVTNAVMNYDAVKAMLDIMPGVAPITNQLQPDTDTTKATNAAGNSAADDRSNWTITDYMEKDGAALAVMAEKQPEKYQALAKTYQYKPKN